MSDINNEQIKSFLQSVKLCLLKNGNYSSNLQNSAHAMGVAFNGTDQLELDGISRDTVLQQITELITSSALNVTDLICCIIAAGCIGDQRTLMPLNTKILHRATEAIEYLQDYYNYVNVQAASKARNVALKLMTGTALSADDERFLLEKLNY